MTTAAEVQLRFALFLKNVEQWAPGLQWDSYAGFCHSEEVGPSKCRLPLAYDLKHASVFMHLRYVLLHLTRLADGPR